MAFYLKGQIHDRTVNFFKHKPNSDGEANNRSKRISPRIRSKQKRINSVSEKRKLANKIYVKLRKKFLAENPECQIKWDDKCSKIANQIHHTKFRGKYYLDVRWWKGGCSHCHRLVTDNGKEAEARGHIIREYSIWIGISF